MNRSNGLTMTRRGEIAAVLVLVLMTAALSVMIIVEARDGGMCLLASVGLAALPAVLSAAMAHDIVMMIKEHKKKK